MAKPATTSIVVVEGPKGFELGVVCDPNNMPDLLVDSDGAFYVKVGQLLSGSPGNRFSYRRCEPYQI